MNHKDTIIKQTTLTMLLALFASFIAVPVTLPAADVPAVKAPMVPEAKLDLSKPIRFDIQLGPAQYPAGKPKGNTYQPTVLGGCIEAGEPTAAYAPNMTHVYSAGYSPDDDHWSICPYGPRRRMDNEYSWSSRIRLAAATVGCATTCHELSIAHQPTRNIPCIDSCSTST